MVGAEVESAASCELPPTRHASRPCRVFSKMSKLREPLAHDPLRATMTTFEDTAAVVVISFSLLSTVTLSLSFKTILKGLNTFVE